MMHLTNHCDAEFTMTFKGKAYRDFYSVVGLAASVSFSMYERDIILPPSFNREKARCLIERLPKPDHRERSIPPEHQEVTLSFEIWQTCYQALVLILYGTHNDDHFFYSVLVLSRQEMVRLLEEFHAVYLRMVRIDSKRRNNPNVNEVIKLVLAGQLKQLSTLLTSGNVNIDERDKNHCTALMHAASDGMCAIAQVLISAGADVNAPGFSDERPLHHAARNDQVDMVKLLLKSNADVDLENKHGNTALWEAVRNSTEQSELIPVLLAAGADPHHKNKSGKTPVELANKITNRDVAKFFR